MFFVISTCGNVIHKNTKLKTIDSNGDLLKQCAKCKECKLLEFFSKHKKKADGYNGECRECRSVMFKNWREKNVEKNKQRCKEWDASNKERRQLYKQNRRQIPSVKIIETMRSRMRDALDGKMKSANSINLLGCSSKYFKEYLEYMFDENMTWENRGYNGWHIDHIVPCAYFDLTNPTHQHRAFSYHNTRPMWGAENMSKNDKLTKESYITLAKLEYMFPDEPEFDSDGEEDYEEFRQAEFSLF